LSTDFSIHHIVNGTAAYHIENAANLGKVPLSGAWVMIAPVKIEKGSGGPARVWVVFR
jgi:kynurenine formamidase